VRLGQAGGVQSQKLVSVMPSGPMIRSASRPDSGVPVAQASSTLSRPIPVSYSQPASSPPVPMPAVRVGGADADDQADRAAAVLVGQPGE
jgi:hypothetical protein